jgi:hypothetical protein
MRSEVSHRAKEERNILRAIQRRQANWIEHILHRNCLVKHDSEGKIGGRQIRCKQLLDDLKEIGGYWKLQEEARDHTLENSL